MFRSVSFTMNLGGKKLIVEAEGEVFAGDDRGLSSGPLSVELDEIAVYDDASDAEIFPYGEELETIEQEAVNKLAAGDE